MGIIGPTVPVGKILVGPITTPWLIIPPVGVYTGKGSLGSGHLVKPVPPLGAISPGDIIPPPGIY
jgi:hypothetical protein